ncbi:hypothetical protein M0811_05499 [Anaeramoeba ignava]|uniref:Uncharacterized protein n=1 Tax=Anaeramoeba ignava TaxID=1746090 RepID=A0A9Q0LSN1_ANAIG|nr:hypothetical protein M0811_05499 [Anaeramoeba ignava]
MHTILWKCEHVITLTTNNLTKNKLQNCRQSNLLKEYYQPTKQQSQDIIMEELGKQIHLRNRFSIGINLTGFDSKSKYDWKQALRKRWRDTMRGIEIGNQSRTNYWTEVKRIAKLRKDII